MKKQKKRITLHLTLNLRPWIYYRLMGYSYGGQMPIHKMVEYWITMIVKSAIDAEREEAKKYDHYDA